MATSYNVFIYLDAPKPGSVLSKKTNNSKPFVSVEATKLKSRTKMSSQKTFGFGLRAFKRFPELIPLTLFVAAASTWGVSFIMYSLLTKPDVRVIGKDVEMPYEKVKPTESRKLVTLNQKYEPITELEQLRKEIGSFKS